jgi:hypothetical protein
MLEEKVAKELESSVLPQLNATKNIGQLRLLFIYLFISTYKTNYK